MTTNVGYVDRAIRQTVGVMMLALGFSGVVLGPMGAVLIVVGAVFFTSGTVGVCLLYRALGWSTISQSA